ncbi:MAG TPA: hypothetical protein VJ943_13595 [Desulfotignum sp.]|nr:hypothetical protein [Desulfotignum sp.]
MLQEMNDIIRIWPDIKSIFAVAHSEAEYDRQFGVSPVVFI